MALSVLASTIFIYDDLGRLVEIHRPNGDRTIFTYDQAGNIINISVITVDAVEIHNAEDLSNIRNNLAGSFRLMNHIDLADIEWIPIGTRFTPFTGMIDGNDFTISNLTIDLPTQNDVGLFGRNSGTIINLSLSNADIAGVDNTGAIAGHNSANIIESRVDGLSVVRGNNNVGGIAGHNSGGILRAFTTSDVIGNDNVGGFAGIIAGGNIDQAYATGDVLGNTNIGGFTGHLTDGTSVIRNAFSTGQVFGESNDAGFAGYITSGRIENSYSISNNANGFRGNDGGVIVNSYFDQDIILSSNVAAFESVFATMLAASEARTTEEMMTQSNFTNWDFTNIWSIDEGNSYPILQELSEPAPDDSNINADIAWLTFDVIRGDNEYESAIRTNLHLPTVSLNRAVITWVSSDPTVITNTGIVSRPAFGEDAAEVMLTATFRHAFETGSRVFNLTVEPECPFDAERPTISQQPENISVLTNEPARLSVSASVTVGQLSYQWYEHTADGDIRIEGETQSFFYAPTNTHSSRVYYVVVTNTDTTATGSETSSAISEQATVTVGVRHDAELPVITGHSNDFNVPIGGTAVLAVTAEVSRGDLTYQWYEHTAYGNTPIWGATLPAFIAPTYEIGQRQYFISITNTDLMATGLQTVTTTGSAITVAVNETALFHNIDLSVSGVHRFTDRDEGYDYTEVVPVSITNAGLDGVTGLNVTISGGDANAFSVTSPGQTSLNDDLSTYFTVTPNIGLPPKNYISIISVSGNNNVLVSFVASFTVGDGTQGTPGGNEPGGNEPGGNDPGGNERPTEHTITATAGTGGTIAPSGDVTIKTGENRTFTITPNSGYIVSDVLVDGTSIGAVNRYTFINVTANHRIHALFVVDDTDGEDTTPPPQQQPSYSSPPSRPVTRPTAPSASTPENAETTDRTDNVHTLTELTPNQNGEIIITLEESEIFIHIPIASLGTNDLIVISQSGNLRLPSRTLANLRQTYGETLILSLNQNGGIEIRFE